ncbi:MAG: N-formylglutamate amidohydrolase [Zymomonas mobilis]|uniref:N-formylglutamate amidohydrolase n=1 Tax=Zymomonas mobilis TaxID=542 RepID=A0A542W2B4_ZYMMB|nr:N-formylglutamate amidohydrolase [Zymomonas mobilis]TQL17726.1 N-formylglutamate amidohydrolase [Zymomonas mobilis]
MKDRPAILPLGEWPSRKPVLLTVPHAGRFYPEDLLQKLRCEPEKLIIFEDRFADLLVDTAVASGFSALVACSPRVLIDLNRHHLEIDPMMIDPPLSLDSVILTYRSRNGLGLFPNYLSGFGALYHHPIALSEAQHRIENYHLPWHSLIAKALGDIKSHYGAAVLLDIHSMPPLIPDGAGAAADIVIGTAYGHSASSEVAFLAAEIIKKHGLNPVFNKPYAGGYTLDRHGKPSSSRHALQIEINRALYLDDNLYHPSDAVSAIRHLVHDMAETMTHYIEASN